MWLSFLNSLRIYIQTERRFLFNPSNNLQSADRECFLERTRISPHPLPWSKSLLKPSCQGKLSRPAWRLSGTAYSSLAIILLSEFGSWVEKCFQDYLQADLLHNEFVHWLVISQGGSEGARWWAISEPDCKVNLYPMDMLSNGKRELR
jgi:hypothetical protein